VDATVLIVFAFVYAGMIFGRFPGLGLDRTGVALLGAIALMASGRIRTSDLWSAVDLPTMTLLLGLMIVSAQFRLSGFYAHLVRRLAAVEASPQLLLGLVVGITGVLSAVLANDIVCLAVTPILAESCVRRRLDPKPFLLALACAANVGSAATLIGNPQNMLIGQVLGLSFGRYMADAAIPSILGLALVWLTICLLTAGRWEKELVLGEVAAPPLDRFQTLKGSIVLGGLVVLFLVGTWPREIVALAAGGLLLCSHRVKSREMLGLVDWQLLVLFFGLFVVNHATSASGNLGLIESGLAAHGIQVSQPGWLFGLSVILSNLVSNVPAVMLLLPSATHPSGGPILALASTLAGNLLVVGSIANIIVIDQAARVGIKITWREHARVGVPVTLLTLAVAAAWLWLRAA
jgi:Na+/H+ antiporter NhaD/arsenite permease-like protein